MKKLLIIVLLLCSVTIAQAWVKIYFSPYENCEAQWLAVIDYAKVDIWVSCFGLTNVDIANRLVVKKRAGVRVVVCIDKRQSMLPSDKSKYLAENGIEVVVKKTGILEHNKMVCADGGTNRPIAIMGSWNLSKNAQKQDNSIIVTNEKKLAVPIRAAIERIYLRDKIGG